MGNKRKLVDLGDPRCETVLVPTPDDWYPTINGEVRARLCVLSTGQWRVCFWGGNDFGLQFDADTYEEAKALFVLTTKTGLVQQWELRALGFVTA